MKSFKEYVAEAHWSSTPFETDKDKVDKIMERVFYDVENYEINDDGSVDVDDTIIITNASYRKLPIRFNIVKGSFHIQQSHLATLEGFPKEIGGDLRIGQCKIASLEHGPIKVGKDYYVNDNRLTSLKGAPPKIKGTFDCSNNDLDDLKFCPSEVGNFFNASNNYIESLDDCPKEVGAGFNVKRNKIDYKNLHNIHKFVKSIGGLNKSNFDIDGLKNVLSLCLIEGNFNYDGNFSWDKFPNDISKESDKLRKIINKYTCGGRRVLVAFQEELINEGFEEFANL
jgi:hypothetical protein